MALQAIVANPEFVLPVRASRSRAPLPGTAYRIFDIELASRLSYFLWSSAPDDELHRLVDPEETA